MCGPHSKLFDIFGPLDTLSLTCPVLDRLAIYVAASIVVESFSIFGLQRLCKIYGGGDYIHIYISISIINIRPSRALITGVNDRKHTIAVMRIVGGIARLRDGRR